MIQYKAQFADHFHYMPLFLPTWNIVGEYNWLIFLHQQYFMSVKKKWHIMEMVGKLCLVMDHQTPLMPILGVRVNLTTIRPRPRRSLLTKLIIKNYLDLLHVPFLIITPLNKLLLWKVKSWLTPYIYFPPVISKEMLLVNVCDQSGDDPSRQQLFRY
jgi:hypothetical protein